MVSEPTFLIGYMNILFLFVIVRVVALCLLVVITGLTSGSRLMACHQIRQLHRSWVSMMRRGWNHSSKERYAKDTYYGAIVKENERERN